MHTVENEGRAVWYIFHTAEFPTCENTILALGSRIVGSYKSQAFQWTCLYRTEIGVAEHTRQPAVGIPK